MYMPMDVHVCMCVYGNYQGNLDVLQNIHPTLCVLWGKISQWVVRIPSWANRAVERAKDSILSPSSRHSIFNRHHSEWYFFPRLLGLILSIKYFPDLMISSFPLFSVFMVQIYLINFLLDINGCNIYRYRWICRN